MTSEQAIKMLRVIKRTVFLGNSKFYEALNKAIEALRAQDLVNKKSSLVNDLVKQDVPDMNVGDMVYRQAAIDALTEYGNGRTVYISVKEAVRRIKYLPSAEKRTEERTKTHECDSISRLNDLIFDINPAEIYAQIEADNLKNWCEIMQTEMKMAMVQLPCWCKDGKVEHD